MQNRPQVTYVNIKCTGKHQTVNANTFSGSATWMILSIHESKSLRPSVETRRLDGIVIISAAFWDKSTINMTDVNC